MLTSLKRPLTRQRVRRLTLFAAFACIPALAATAAENCKLTITTDKPDAVYSVNESITFVAKLQHAGHPNAPAADAEVKWTISQDGVAPIQSGTGQLKNGELRLSGKLDKPGFLRCEVTLPAGNEGCANAKALTTLAGAAVSPTQIPPSMPVPDDFDAFWDAQKALLRSVRPEVKLTPVKVAPQNGKDLTAFDIQADVGDGIRVSGFIVYPTGAKAHSLPAMLTVHGAGVRSSLLPTAARWAGEGMLAMDINAHGIPNRQPKEFYDNLFRTDLKGYHTRVPADAQDVYFRKMFLRVLAAIDILAERPEWDGKTLVLYGTSQGGAQSLAAAALDERVTLSIAGVPAMCDHSGMVAKRATGWPRNVPVSKDGTPDQTALQAMRYYDMMNFATRIKAPVAMTVGFIDKTCPPTSVYAAYNNLGGEKSIYEDIAAGHTNTPQATAFMHRKVLQHLDAQAHK